MYELFYGTGGHGGPYPSLESAIRKAIALLRGSPSEHIIEVKPRSLLSWDRARAACVVRKCRDTGAITFA